jgi:hypothetical protein
MLCEREGGYFRFVSWGRPSPLCRATTSYRTISLNCWDAWEGFAVVVHSILMILNTRYIPSGWTNQPSIEATNEKLGHLMPKFFYVNVNVIANSTLILALKTSSSMILSRIRMKLLQRPDFYNVHQS